MPKPVEPTRSEWFALCRRIIADAQGQFASVARQYASAGLVYITEDMPDVWLDGERHWVSTQALYIRSNLGSWRGEQARREKALLDRFAKLG